MIAVLRRAFGTDAGIDVDRAVFNATRSSDAAAVGADTWFRQFVIAVLGHEPDDDSPDTGGDVLQEIPDAGKHDPSGHDRCELDRLPRKDCACSLARAQGGAPLARESLLCGVA